MCELAEQTVGVIAALHRPVAEREQCAAGREPRRRILGGVSVKPLARDLDPALEAERLAF